MFDTLDTIVCDIFQWRVNGEVYTADKVQTEYFNTIHGCDSIHHLILEMHYRFDTTEYREACNTFYWPVDRRTLRLNPRTHPHGLSHLPRHHV